MHFTSIVFVLFSICIVWTKSQQVNWTLVRPIHEAPNFFEDYPFLRGLWSLYSPVINDFLPEGNLALESEYPYQVR